MKKNISRKRAFRGQRTHNKIRALSDKPRLVVIRSLRQISAQIIDDEKGETIASATSLKINIDKKKMSKTEIASEVGKVIAEEAQKKGIKKVAFDRGRYKYHGRIKALAEAARKEGLEF